MLKWMFQSWAGYAVLWPPCFLLHNSQEWCRHECMTTHTFSVIQQGVETCMMQPYYEHTTPLTCPVPLEAWQLTAVRDWWHYSSGNLGQPSRHCVSDGSHNEANPIEGWSWKPWRHCPHNRWWSRGSPHTNRTTRIVAMQAKQWLCMQTIKWANILRI